jgi:hypothetical protein
MKTTRKIAKTTERYAIIANRSYGLYAGIVESVTPQEDGTLRVEARECRHVARWFGRTGGITSLAAHGLCGPRAGESRIGAPVRATLSGVVNLFDCSTEARASIEAAAAK